MEDNEAESSAAPTAHDDSSSRRDDDDALPPPQRRTTAVQAPPPLPLDWTQGASLFCPEANSDNNGSSSNDEGGGAVVLYPWDVVRTNHYYGGNADADDDDWLRRETQVTLVGTAGRKITRMGRDLHARLSPDITHLVLRSHLIRKMEGGMYRLAKLRVLELYDNQIDELNFFDAASATTTTTTAAVVDDTATDNERQHQPPPPSIDLGSSSGMYFQNLKVLDISYNVIRDMEPLVCCTNLQELCKRHAHRVHLSYLSFLCVYISCCCCHKMNLLISLHPPTTPSSPVSSHIYYTSTCALFNII